MENVIFDYGDLVTFKLKHDDKEFEVEGTIEIIDRYGTFEQNDEPSYDIMIFNFCEEIAPVGRCLIKHIRQSSIISISEEGAFKFWVPMWDSNAKRVKLENIFINKYINAEALKGIKQYKHGRIKIDNLLNKMRIAFRHEFWARHEYEVSIGPAFIKPEDIEHCEKVDIYWFLIDNSEVIVDGMLKQWLSFIKKKEYLKNRGE